MFIEYLISVLIFIAIYIGIFKKISSSHSLLIYNSKALIISNISLKLLSIVFLYFSLQGQSSNFYVINRWFLFSIFLFISFIYFLRTKYISSYLWIPFATIFNPIVPFYFFDFNIWRDIDKVAILFNVITIIGLDLFFYKNASEQANIIYRRLFPPFSYSYNVLKVILYEAESRYKWAIKNVNGNREYNFEISIELLRILKQYRDSPGFYISNGIEIIQQMSYGHIFEKSKKEMDIFWEKIEKLF